MLLDASYDRKPDQKYDYRKSINYILFVIKLQITEGAENTVWNESNSVLLRHNIINYIHKGKSHTGRPNLRKRNQSV